MKINQWIILAGMLLVLQATSAQKIIVLLPESMLEPSIRPMALLDTNTACKNYMDSMYFNTIKRKQINYESMVVKAQINNPFLLDSITSKLEAAKSTDSASIKCAISIRIFECNLQVKRVYLSKEETFNFFQAILPLIDDVYIRLIIQNYISNY